MSRLMLLVLGMLLGMALVLVPIERGWVSPEGLRALLRREAAPVTVEQQGPAPSATVSPPVVSDTAPFGAAAPQPLPPPPCAGAGGCHRRRSRRWKRSERGRRHLLG